LQFWQIDEVQEETCWVNKNEVFFCWSACLLMLGKVLSNRSWHVSGK